MEQTKTENRRFVTNRNGRSIHFYAMDMGVDVVMDMDMDMNMDVDIDMDMDIDVNTT